MVGNKEIDSKYEILKKINTGGTSEVYLATGKKLNNQWAIKKIKKSLTLASSVMAEAEIMINLRHPYLPQIFDIVEDEKYFYIIMEYVPGENLRSYLRVNGPVPENTVVRWGIKLCDVITYLHKNKIVYRDMKPANIMCSMDNIDNIKLIDFGIAKRYGTHDSEKQKALGTQGYAAPEQYSPGGQLDERTDIYGLGVTLFQLLTDISPVSYDNIFSIRLQNPALSSGLDKIILKCTNKDPNKRYQSAAELKKALLSYHQLDNEYLARKEKTLKKFFLFVGATVLCYSLAISSYMLSYQQSSSRYEQLLSGTPESSQIEEAISIKPGNEKGYLMLLDSYGETIDQNELSSFSHIYSTYQEQFNDSVREDIAMTAGERILTAYEEESLRAKLTMADKYFETVVDVNDENYEKYGAAKCYCDLNQFYQDFVTQSDSALIKEATNEDFAKLIKNMRNILKTIDSYRGSEKNNLALTTDELLLGIISEQADNMHNQGIRKEEIATVIDAIESQVNKIEPSSDLLKSKQESILNGIKSTNKALNRAYTERGV